MIDSANSDTYRTWKARLDAADKVMEKWEERADKIVRRYRDERNATENKQRKFNILWANVQVLKPSLYGRKAKPHVSRRFQDKDPVARTASLILERALDYEASQYAWFDNAMHQSVEDRLLPGRGICWVRYEPHIETEAQVSNATDAQVERLAYECAPVDYVYWKDFSHSPARAWDEVWWVRRRVYMTKEEGVQRFGDVFNSVPLDSVADDDKTPHEDDKKAKISEIWDKTTRKVYWLADDHPVLLDERDDPLELDEFFPCPKPLYATTTNGSLVPVPDYAQYQDQAEELDALTQRIWMLTKALKVRGLHNAEFPALRRLLDEGGDNTMIAVDAWAAFAEKGGMLGAVAFLPIKEVGDVLAGLYLAREQAKQVIYETVGLADIMRGSSDANETLGAQQLKANFGGLRLKEPQKQVAQYATDVLRLMAQVMCKRFKPETLVAISGVDKTADLNDPQQAQQIQEALLLLQSDSKNFRIEVEADSLAQIDEAQEKAEATEFVSAVGTLLKEAAPIAQTMPAMMPLLGTILMFSVRRMRAGRTIEGEFEQALQAVAQAPQAPQPDPAMQEQQVKMQQEGERMKQEGQAQQMKGMELQYGETFAKERIAMQQQLAAKDLEVQRMQAERELEKRVAAIAEQEAQMAMREMQIDIREQQSKQSEQVRSTVLDLKKKGEGAKVIQMKERLAELGVDPAEIEEGADDGQSRKVAKLLQELLAAVQAPQHKTGTIKAPSGRTYQVDVTQQTGAA